MQSAKYKVLGRILGICCPCNLKCCESEVNEEVVLPGWSHVCLAWSAAPLGFRTLRETTGTYVQRR